MFEEEQVTIKLPKSCQEVYMIVRVNDQPEGISYLDRMVTSVSASCP